jgi:Protein of unknown function (DUF973).
METRNVEISALRTLRGGFLYLLVAVIVGIVAAFAGLLYIIAVGIMLCTIFAMIRPGVRQLSEVDNGFRISYTGTTFMLVGLAILVLGLIVLAAVSAAAGSSPEAIGGTVVSGLTLALGVPLIGAVIAWIGNILTFVVGAFKLYSRYQNSLYMAAGILFVLDIALLLNGFFGNILSLVGCILMYIALDDTINKLSTAATTTAQA